VRILHRVRRRHNSFALIDYQAAKKVHKKEWSAKR
jgi:hypothetical protein